MEKVVLVVLDLGTVEGGFGTRITCSHRDWFGGIMFCLWYQKTY